MKISILAMATLLASPSKLSLFCVRAFSSHAAAATASSTRSALNNKSIYQQKQQQQQQQQDCAASSATTCKMSSTADIPTATTANPLLDHTALPKFTSIEPSQLTPAMKSILSQLETDFASMESSLSSAIENGSAPSYEQVLPALEKMQHPLGFAWGIAGHLNGVKNTDELRKAYEENQPSVVQASMKFGQSKVLYDALLAVQKSWEAGNSNDGSDEEKEGDFELAQKQRAISNNLRSMTLQGVGLPVGSPEQVRFNEMKLRFAELSNAFGNNVLDATKAFGLHVEDPSDVEGVPESALGMWAQIHHAHLVKEAGDDEEEKKRLSEVEVDAKAGPWRISLDGPSYVAAMQHLPNRELRKKVYLGYLTRASEFTAEAAEAAAEAKEATAEKKEGGEEKAKISKNNVLIINEMLKLRKEMSGLLGFDNFAEQSLASKMAPNVQSITDLSNLILEKALPACRFPVNARKPLSSHQRNKSNAGRNRRTAGRARKLHKKCANSTSCPDLCQHSSNVYTTSIHSIQSTYRTSSASSIWTRKGTRRQGRKKRTWGKRQRSTSSRSTTNSSTWDPTTYICNCGSGNTRASPIFQHSKNVCQLECLLHLWMGRRRVAHQHNMPAGLAKSWTSGRPNEAELGWI